jgi:hypothetical protein
VSEDEKALVKDSVDVQRLRRVAGVLLAGGAVAIAAGIFGSSLIVVLLGVGWIFGGAAVSSTIPSR